MCAFNVKQYCQYGLIANLRYSILFYSILFYSILFYSILFYLFTLYLLGKRGPHMILHIRRHGEERIKGGGGILEPLGGSRRGRGVVRG